MIVPGAGVGRTKKPKVVRHPPTMWLGGTIISQTFAHRHRPVATCCSGIVRFVFLRDHLSGLVSPVGRTVKREGNVPTQYDHGEGSEGLERHVRRSARFFFPRRLLILRRGAAYQQRPEWSDDVRHGRALHRSVQGVHGVAGRDGTVSGRSSWIPHRLHSQGSRERALPRARVRGSL